MGRSLEIVVFFLHFFLGVVFSELGANQSECSESRCGHHGPAIRFPFRLKGLQPDYCGHPGFDLYCNEKNQTVLELPSSVKLLVKNIDYKYQELRLYDQHYCLERQLPHLNLSLTPFQITTPEYDSWNYTFLNCSSSIDESQANRVPCLEVPGFHVYAVESDSLITSIPVLSCTKIYDLNNIPMIIYSLYLNWTTPRCGNCEAKGMTCRLKKNNSKETEIECFGRPAKGNKRLWIIIAISISLILLLLGFLCYKRKRKLRLEGEERERQEALIHELTTLEGSKNANEVETNRREGRDLKIFSFACIMVATNNFSSENKLGQGGFGPVYKGKLPEGQKIAVKRLSRTSGQGLVEFKNELILIAKLQHMNLVRILGCCIHGEEKILIYEYMSNKSLDYYLFDPTKRELLDWKKRSNIIEGVAQGLLYLHKYSRLRIIHRDLKASNILLDENMNPKISDFGLARIFGQNETEAKTNRPIGTYGYMSPEYAIEGTFSIKSDVFSFGVIILEIMTGKKNYSSYHLDRPLNLIGYAWELWKEGAALELMDPTMGDSCPTHQLLRIIHLGLLCVQDRATDRPTMSDVISMLSNETMPLSDPKQPAFFTGCSVMEVNSHEGKSKDCSVNGLSISTMNAR